MKSDVITVNNRGDGIEEALAASSSSALYRGLGHKEALHLRLLAEETLGMMRQITKEETAQFWVDSDGKSFELHLVAHPSVTGAMRAELLKVDSDIISARIGGPVSVTKSIVHHLDLDI